MDTENHPPLYWTVDTIYNNEIDNIEVYFFDDKGKPHYGTLANENYTLTVQDKDGGEHSWSVFRDDRHRFYNPNHPGFSLILRTLKANEVIATLHYQKSLIVQYARALELVESIDLLPKVKTLPDSSDDNESEDRLEDIAFLLTAIKKIMQDVSELFDSVEEVDVNDEHPHAGLWGPSGLVLSLDEVKKLSSLEKECKDHDISV